MKKRLMSTIVMLIVVIPLVYYGGAYFKIGVGIVSILALKEILDLKVSHHKIPFLISIFSMISLLLLIYADYDAYSIMFGITYRGIAIMFLGILGSSIFITKDNYSLNDAFFLIGTILLIGVSFNTLILVRMLSLYKFIFLILIFILTDTFAYIGGKLLGKHKLIPSVSPGKTIEGTVIGTLIGTIGTSIFYHYLIKSLTFKVGAGILILSLVGQLGDLIFSKIKRENNIKDYSNLIPGHGGILDRLDSTIAIMLGYLILYSIF